MTAALRSPVQAMATAAEVGRLALRDCSLTPRTGFKGRGAPEWLREQGVSLPDGPNLAMAQADGSLVAALSWEEHLVLGPAAPRLEAVWSMQAGLRCYHLPRLHSHCRFDILGEAAPAMLAKLCGVDLRPHRFAAGSVAQTQAARVSVAIVRAVNESPHYHLLADRASAAYLWDCLTDAGGEFGVGILEPTAQLSNGR